MAGGVTPYKQPNVNDQQFLDKSPEERLAALSDKNLAQQELGRVKNKFMDASANGASQADLDNMHNWANQVRSASGISNDDPTYGNAANSAARVNTAPTDPPTPGPTGPLVGGGQYEYKYNPAFTPGKTVDLNDLYSAINQYKPGQTPFNMQQLQDLMNTQKTAGGALPTVDNSKYQDPAQIASLISTMKNAMDPLTQQQKSASNMGYNTNMQKLRDQWASRGMVASGGASGAEQDAAVQQAQNLAGIDAQAQANAIPLAFQQANLGLGESNQRFNQQTSNWQNANQQAQQGVTNQLGALGMQNSQVQSYLNNLAGAKGLDVGQNQWSQQFGLNQQQNDFQRYLANAGLNFQQANYTGKYLPPGASDLINQAVGLVNQGNGSGAPATSTPQPTANTAQPNGTTAAATATGGQPTANALTAAATANVGNPTANGMIGNNISNFLPGGQPTNQIQAGALGMKTPSPQGQSFTANGYTPNSNPQLAAMQQQLAGMGVDASAFNGGNTPQQMQAGMQRMGSTLPAQQAQMQTILGLAGNYPYMPSGTGASIGNMYPDMAGIGQYVSGLENPAYETTNAMKYQNDWLTKMLNVVTRQNGLDVRNQHYQNLDANSAARLGAQQGSNSLGERRFAWEQDNQAMKDLQDQSTKLAAQYTKSAIDDVVAQGDRDSAVKFYNKHSAEFRDANVNRREVLVEINRMYPSASQGQAGDPLTEAIKSLNSGK